MSEIMIAMDFMVGTADQSYASKAAARALVAIAEARNRGIPVIFTKVGFRPGHPEVSSRNKVFGPLLGTQTLVGAASALAEAFLPLGNEPVLEKKRFSAFAGSGLSTIVQASGATSTVLCGLSTSGVVLSTSLELIDADFQVTVLSDACADPDEEIHNAILHRIFASRARVCTVAEWASSQATTGVAAS